MIKKQFGLSVKKVFSEIKPTYHTLNYDLELTEDEYNSLYIDADCKDVVTQYLFTPENYSISVSSSPDYLHVWFGYYPCSDITPYKHYLSDLNKLSDFCVIGFDLGQRKLLNNEFENNEAADYFPYCIIRNGKSTWYPDTQHTEKHDLIREAIEQVAVF